MLETHGKGRLAAPRNTGRTKAAATHEAMGQRYVMTVRPTCTTMLLELNGTQEMEGCVCVCQESTPHQGLGLMSNQLS